MQLAIAQLNWGAVAAAFAGYYVLGALWFAWLFNKQYKLSLGLPPDAKPGNAPIFFVGPATCTLLVVVGSALLMKGLGITLFGEAMLFAAVVGVTFLVATTFNTAINPLFPRPLHYGLVCGGYHMVGIGLACAILVAIP